MTAAHILVSDQFNNRFPEVDHSGKVVFSYDTNALPGSVAMPTPTRAVRLRNGDTLISDQFKRQVIVINPAKAIGDYTGLTPPFRD